MHILHIILHIECIFICIFSAYAYYAYYLAYWMHIYLHIFLHIKMNILCIIQNIDCIFICIYFYIFQNWNCIFSIWCSIFNTYLKSIFVCILKIHIFTIDWSPTPELSCLHTTLYSHPHSLLICHRLLLESQLILWAWQRVFSLLHPRGQEEGVPVWRRLVSHTRLVIVLGARKWPWNDTGQPRLRLKIILINK